VTLCQEQARLVTYFGPSDFNSRDQCRHQH